MSEIFSPLTTSINPNIMNSSSERSKIDRIVIHHNATTNKDVAMNTWLQGAPANTSAHYEITPTEIIGCVGEEQTAWHSGNWDMNLRSIGLEHLNSTGAPNWLVDDRTLENSAQLIADICKRYGFAPSSTTIIPHSVVSATACPFSINVSSLIEKAKKYYNGSSSNEQNNNDKPQEEEEMIKFEVVEGGAKGTKGYLYQGRFIVGGSASSYNAIYKKLADMEKRGLIKPIKEPISSGEYSLICSKFPSHKNNK